MTLSKVNKGYELQKYINTAWLSPIMLIPKILFLYNKK